MSTDSTIGMTSASNSVNFFQMLNPISLPTLMSDSAANSQFLPSAHKTQAASVPGYTDVPPQRPGVDFGGDDSYKYYNNDHNVIKKATLFVKVDGLLRGGTGVWPRYVDDLLCRAITYVEFRFGGEPVQRLYGDRIHFLEEHEVPAYELGRRYRMRDGGLSDFERARNALSSRWLALELPFFFSEMQGNAFHQYAAQRTTEIYVKWREIGSLLQQNVDGSNKPTPLTGTTSPYKMDSFVRFEVSAISESTKQIYVEKMQALGDGGWCYLYHDVQHIRDIQLSSSGVEQSVKLDNLDKYTYGLNLIIRPAANLTPNLLNNRWTERIDLAAVKLDLSGSTYWPKLNRDFMKQVINGCKFNGNPYVPIYTIPLGTDTPDIHNHATGGIDMTTVSAPMLYLTLSGVPDQTYYMDIWADVHNYARLAIGHKRSAMEAVQRI